MLGIVAGPTSHPYSPSPAKQKTVDSPEGKSSIKNAAASKSIFARFRGAIASFFRRCSCFRSKRHEPAWVRVDSDSYPSSQPGATDHLMQTPPPLVVPASMCSPMLSPSPQNSPASSAPGPGYVDRTTTTQPLSGANPVAIASAANVNAKNRGPLLLVSKSSEELLRTKTEKLTAKSEIPLEKEQEKQFQQDIQEINTGIDLCRVVFNRLLVGAPYAPMHLENRYIQQ